MFSLFRCMQPWGYDAQYFIRNRYPNAVFLRGLEESSIPEPIALRVHTKQSDTKAK